MTDWNWEGFFEQLQEKASRKTTTTKQPMTDQQHLLAEMTDSKTTSNDRQIMSSEITPPRKLVEQWIYEDGDEIRTSSRWYHIVCTKAAQWGADQELDACVEWLKITAMTKPVKTVSELASELLNARRPKPPSQAEEALDLIDRIEFNSMAENLGNQKAFNLKELEVVRRALKRLQEYEQQVEAQVDG